MNALTFKTPTLERVASKAGRLYRLPDGTLVPGVTTALDVINKPALVPWAANAERQHCIQVAGETFNRLLNSDEVNTGDGLTFPEMETRFGQQLRENLGKQKAHHRLMRQAADIGSETHSAIERWIKEKLGQSVGPMPQISEPALVAFMAFEDWAKKNQFEPLAAEVMVFDPVQDYAGTLDWVARIKGVLVVGDWKTGAAIYPEAILQNSAYISALRKQLKIEEPIHGVIVRFPKKIEDVKTDEPFQIRPIYQTEGHRAYVAFLKALDLWKWLHGSAITQPATQAPAAVHQLPPSRFGGVQRQGIYNKPATSR